MSYLFFIAKTRRTLKAYFACKQLEVDYSKNIWKEENHGHGFSEKKLLKTGILFFLFSVVYLTLTLNSPVKIYSLIHTNKKIHINKAKHTIIKCFLHIFT